MNSNKEIFINVSAGSTRIAIVEDKVLAELHIDIADHKRMVGNIYKGLRFSPTLARTGTTRSPAFDSEGARLVSR